MKIKQVTIENFRNHKHTVIDFTDHHVLVGENGSGKTSVLVAINYALSSSFLSSRLDEQDFQNQDGGDIVVEVVFDEPFAVKMPDLYSNHQLLLADQVRLTAKRRDRAAPGKAFSDPFQTSTRIPALCYSDVKELAGKKLPGDLTVDKLPTSVTWFEKEDKRGYEVVRRSGNSTSYREDQVNLSQDAEGFPNVFYFDRKREKQSDVGFGSTLTRILSDLSWRYRKGWDQEKVLKTFEAFDKQVSGVVQKDADKRLWTDWKKLLGELLDEDTSNLELSILNIEAPFRKAFFSSREGTNQIDLDGAGSGVSLIATLLLLEVVSKRAGEDIILLVDEPELHLHPQLQTGLAKHLRESTTQSIISTHSPQLADIGNWRSITRMTRSSVYPRAAKLKEVVGPKNLEQHLDDIPGHFFHRTIFSPDDHQVFFARKVLLVEGPVDRYGIQRVADLLGMSLAHLTVISCNGKEKIPHYATICSAFEIPYFVLYDLDNDSTGKDSAKHTNQNATISEAIKGAEKHAFDTSFERLLGVGKSNHKTTSAMQAIDELTATTIPQAIEEAVQAIGAWYTRAPDKIEPAVDIPPTTATARQGALEL